MSLGCAFGGVSGGALDVQRFSTLALAAIPPNLVPEAFSERVSGNDMICNFSAAVAQLTNVIIQDILFLRLYLH